MTPILERAGLHESWEEYRVRAQSHAARHGLTTMQVRWAWRLEGRRLLNWAGPGTPCPTSNGICVDEGEARPVAS
jgi:hypothetical protein